MNALAVFRKRQKQLSEVCRHEILDFERTLEEEIEQRETAHNEDITQLLEEGNILREERDRLKQENAFLRAEVDGVRALEHRHMSDHMQYEAKVDMKAMQNQGLESTLQKQLDTLRSEYGRLSRAHAFLQERTRRERKTVKAWKIYADQQRGRRRSHVRSQSPLMNKGGRISEEGFYPIGLTPNDKRYHHLAQNTPNRLISMDGENSVCDTDAARQCTVTGAQHTVSRHDLTSAPIPTNLQASSSADVSFNPSQSTEGESIEAAGNSTFNPETNIDENDDEIPIILSTRYLKRKRLPASKNSRITLEEADTEANPQLIKDEEDSDPLESVPRLLGSPKTASMDLDEIDLDVGTPRKRRASKKRDRKALSKLMVKQNKHRNLGHSNRHCEDIAQSNNSESNERKTLAELSSHMNEIFAKNATWLPFKRTTYEFCEVPVYTQLHQAEARGGLVTCSTDRELNYHQPICFDRESIDSNNSSSDTAQKTDELNRMLESKAPARSYLEVQAKRADPRERGIQEMDEASSDITKLKRPMKRHLLSREKIAPVISDASFNSRSRPSLLSVLPPRTESVGPLSTSLPKSRPLLSTSSPSREQMPLEPPSSLRLDDFIINPNSKHGFTFAFDETVRSKEERRCLTGCRRPDCCGDRFKRLVEIGGLPTTKRPLQWNSQDDKDEDQRLLDDFIGKDSCSLSQLRGPARDELIKLAKVKQVADRYGRHRNVFERPTTPPGFWRTDMPTSQELEDDRQKARSEERRKIEERYREALKKDGQWILKAKATP